jgi:hypothetical protein
MIIFIQPSTLPDSACSYVLHDELDDHVLWHCQQYNVSCMVTTANITATISVGRRSLEGKRERS